MQLPDFNPHQASNLPVRDVVTLLPALVAVEMDLLSDVALCIKLADRGRWAERFDWTNPIYSHKKVDLPELPGEALRRVRMEIGSARTAA
jgi:hypothetical protein